MNIDTWTKLRKAGEETEQAAGTHSAMHYFTCGTIVTINLSKEYLFVSVCDKYYLVGCKFNIELSSFLLQEGVL